MGDFWVGEGTGSMLMSWLDPSASMIIRRGYLSR